MGVTRQPVVQPHLQVHHGQGHLGRHGVQEVQRVRHEVAERHGADFTALDKTVDLTTGMHCILMYIWEFQTVILY